MIRNRKSNSDLFGIQRLNNSAYSEGKKPKDKNLNSSCKSQRKYTSKPIDEAITFNSAKKIDSQHTILNTYKLLKHFYKNQSPEYFERVKKYLNGQWQHKRKNFMEHLNKLTFMESDMHKKTFEQVQVDVIKEWRKNPVLYFIRGAWYQYMNSELKSIKQFLNKYNLFKDFIGQVAYLYFGQFFPKKSQKQVEVVITKLTNRTSHFIITQTNTWANLSHQILFPLVHKSLIQEDKGFGNNLQSINLSELGIKSIVLDTTSKQLQTPKTTNQIKNFILETKLREKVLLLKQIRQKMEEQLMKRQKQLISIGKLKNFTVLDKDDFIDCLVYAILKGGISLESLGISIRVIYNLLGEDLNSVLSKLNVDIYLADIQAAYGFLVDYENKQYKKQNRISNLDNLMVSLK